MLQNDVAHELRTNQYPQQLVAIHVILISMFQKRYDLLYNKWWDIAEYGADKAKDICFEEVTAECTKNSSK